MLQETNEKYITSYFSVQIRGEKTESWFPSICYKEKGDVISNHGFMEANLVIMVSSSHGGEQKNLIQSKSSKLHSSYAKL